MLRFQPKPVIYGIEALSLSDSERQFFKTARPFAFILFARNIASAEQVRRLVKELADYSPFAEPLIFIDQEGGRVARIQPPMMQAYPAARRFGTLYERDAPAALQAAYLSARSLAGELRALGINANCAPVCDILSPATHEVIGDRSFGEQAETVCLLAEAQVKGFTEAGVLPVIKHIPGHGRASVDSHKDLPRLAVGLSDLQAHDFVPFRHLRTQIFAMTAHILYEALDRDYPVTLSKHIIGDIIRTDIGFGGLLMSDDLSMEALQGDYGERTRLAIAAGCDLVLHCNGKMAEMVEIDAVLSDMPQESLDFFTNRYKFSALSENWRIWRQEWLDYRRDYLEFGEC